MNFIPEEHYRNRNRIPEEELAQYYGKQVAWSLDGTRIIAGGNDPRKVCAAVRDAGLRSDDVVLAYIPFPEELVLGGAFLPDVGDQE